MATVDHAALPADMRAAVWEGTEPKLVIERIPVPTPKKDEALVRIAATGVCHTDLHVMKGEVGFPSPAVLGHEISGTIVSIGDGTTDSTLSVGDDVVGAFIMPCGFCDFCLKGRDDLCSNFFGLNRLKGHLYDDTSRLTRADGSELAMYSMAGLAEYAVVPIAALAALPAGMPLEEAAILGCAAFTAYGAVNRTAHIEKGESMAVVAIGGVGMSIVQVGRAAGASPIIAVDVSDEKLDAALKLGADFVVNSTKVDPVAEVRRLAGGRGVDVAFEALGYPATFTQATKMLADGGRMVAVGIGAGTAAAEVEITPLVRRGQQILGSFGARTRQDLPAVVELAASGGFELESAVTRRYDLDDVQDAFEALMRGEISGRAIVLMRKD